jgi:hypothetical protein
VTTVATSQRPRRRLAQRSIRWSVRRAGSQYGRVRATHPATVLRWLRNGVLLGVAAAALLYLWVALQARHDIAAVIQARQAAYFVTKASGYAKVAQTELAYSLDQGEVTVTDYIPNTILASLELTHIENSAAIPNGTSDVQNISAQLEIYLAVSETAAIDYRPGTSQIPAGIAAAQEDEIQSGFSILNGEETEALHAQRAAWTLSPGTFWWALLGPVIGMALLVAATARVLARHFRRHVSPWLWGSLALTAATAFTVGFFNVSDEQSLSADPWAGHPATISIALLLYLTAGVLTYTAYRPRLAEYQFQSA